jgi:hypothetical protein
MLLNFITDCRASALSPQRLSFYSLLVRRVGRIRAKPAIRQFATFAKTGVNRQADLVRLAGDLVPPTTLGSDR